MSLANNSSFSPNIEQINSSTIDVNGENTFEVIFLYKSLCPKTPSLHGISFHAYVVQAKIFLPLPNMFHL